MSDRVIPMERSNAPQIINLHNKELPLNNKVQPYPTPTYSTPINIYILIPITIALMAGIGIVSYSIFSTILYNDKSKLLIGLLGLFFLLIGIFIGSRSSILTSITVDYNLGVIIFKTKKICFCFSISNIIEIKQINKVIIKNDFKTTIKTGRRSLHFAFGIFFKLTDGTKVEGCSGLIDKNHEGKKVFRFLKNTLPKNIIFTGNLARNK